MSTNSDQEQTHYYWAIPIVIFILTQSSVAIWWASHLTTQVDGVEVSLEKYVDDIQDGENAQWVVIRQQEKNIVDLRTSAATTNSELRSLNNNFNRVQEQLQTNNNLLRQLLSNKSSASKQ